jgi:hypothetical protein
MLQNKIENTHLYKNLEYTPFWHSREKKDCKTLLLQEERLMEQIHHFFLHPFSIFPLSDVVEADVGRLN